MACPEMQDEMNKELGDASNWIGKVEIQERQLEEKR
jgi:hypothetical protein